MKFVRHQRKIDAQPKGAFKLSISGQTSICQVARAKRRSFLTYRGVSYMVGGDCQLFNLRVAKQRSFLTYRGVSYMVKSDRYAT